MHEKYEISRESGDDHNLGLRSFAGLPKLIPGMMSSFHSAAVEVLIRLHTIVFFGSGRAPGEVIRGACHFSVV